MPLIRQGSMDKAPLSTFAPYVIVLVRFTQPKDSSRMPQETQSLVDRQDEKTCRQI